MRDTLRGCEGKASDVCLDIHADTKLSDLLVDSVQVERERLSLSQDHVG